MFIMGVLDIISIEQAKRWLQLDDVEDDDLDIEIEGLITAAIDWVENYTSYRLWQRSISLPNSKCDQKIALYPVTVTSIKDKDNNDVEYKTYVMPTKLRIRCPLNSIINLTVGFDTPADIPQPLIEAAKKWIVYMYENRDIYEAQLPNDIQMLINQYRRAIA